MRLSLLVAVALVIASSVDAKPIKKLGVVNNSGLIPGTNVVVSNLRDKNGNPMDYSKLVDQMLPMFPKPTSSETVQDKIHKRDNYDPDSAFIQKYCVEQRGDATFANPYHPDLIGRQEASYMVGPGKPLLFPQPGITCGNLPCSITLSEERTFANALTFTVSDSQSNSVTKTVGASSSITNSSSIADTASHTFETNWSNSHAHTTDSSLATTTGTIGTAGNSSSTDNVKIHNHSTDKGGGTSESDESGVNASATVSVSAEEDLLVVKATESASATVGASSSSTKGSTTSYNTQNQDGTQNSHVNGNEFSTQTQNLATQTTGTSDTDTSTTGGSDSNTNSVMTTKGVDITASKDWSNAGTTGSETGTNNQTATTKTTGSTLTYAWPIEAKECAQIVCFPYAEMRIVPYICVDTAQEIAHRIFVSVARAVTSGPNNTVASCESYGTIPCGSLDGVNPLPFVTDDDTIKTITAKDSLHMGQYLQAGNPLASNSGEYTATMESDGSICIWQNGNIKIWTSGATPFIGISSGGVAMTPYTHRARVNMRGHLIIESTGLWSNADPVYQAGMYRETWSTQKVTNNVTVGVPRRAGSAGDNYILVLTDLGALTLYDAAYIIIWTSIDRNGNTLPNSAGFHYQEYYALPTDFVTPDPGLGPDVDPHNSILYGTTPAANVSSFISRDVNCTAGIYSGSGIQSPNGRFAVLVYPTGNIVIKDGVRSMWASNTANMPGTVGPYRLFIADTGDLVLEDSNHRWMWFAKSNGDRDPKSGPFTATILDTGRFVVTSANSTELWESWPQRGMNTVSILTINVKACYAPCNECPSNATTTATTTMSATATATTTITAPTPTSTAPTPNPVSIVGICKNWMTTYKIDPFMSWGLAATNTTLQAQWIFYDCACFGTYSKYNTGILTGKWGNLKDKSIQKQYTDSYCDCPLAQDLYKITPTPKNWGTLKDTTLQKKWMSLGCDANVNRAPFMNNAGEPATPTTVPTPTATATSAPAPTCTGKATGGNGAAGACCTSDGDCKDNCMHGKCGACGKDFIC